MEKTKETQSKGKVSVNVLKLIAVIAIVLSVFAITLITNHRPEKTLYCYFEKNVTESLVPRYECAYLKIVSRDIDKVDIEKLKELNMTAFECSESITDFPQCVKKKLYYSEYPLDLFCGGNCSVDGTICAAYSVEYYKNNISEEDYDFAKYMYESMFMQTNFSDVRALNNQLMDCGRRWD